MTVRTARLIALVLLGLYTVALTYPGFLPFNRIHPLILGLPFSMFWIVLWVAVVTAALVVLNFVESRSDARCEPREGL